jgi:UDP-N-acetylglucosamine--N-acetylmuramyl-(pentapeptide) pyrophosphoryl-undecaprenol N-acetylglucosamine transferase
VVFSKGGFVSVPVCLAAGFRHIPVIIHESDMTPGLANRIAMKKATNVCCNFPETVKYLPEGKAVLTGSPIRQELLKGDKNAGLRLCGFNDKKPIILVVGGSTGAKHVNDAIYDVLPELLEKYQVCHLCGKGKTEPKYDTLPGYKQFEYVKSELKDLFSITDIVVSRAGANAISELLALRLPSILIPLSLKNSRGDQILNAQSFEKQGYSMVIDEENLDEDALVDAIHRLYFTKETFISNMEKSTQLKSISTIIDLIENAADRHIAAAKK